MSVTFLYFIYVGKITAPENPGIVRSIFSYTTATFASRVPQEVWGESKRGWGGQGTRALGPCDSKKEIKDCSQPNNANMKREKGE